MSAAKRLTLAEQAYEELKTQIMLGSLPAGLRLLPEEIAGRLEISPTPVKEALALLERDGLIEGTSRRASTVRRFERDDIIEIFDARTLLEVTAVQRGLATDRAVPELLARLHRTFREHVAEVAKQDESALPRAINLDCAFHEILLELCANNTMQEWHRVVMRQTQTARNYTLKHYSMERLETEHGAIIDTLERGDVGAAIEAVSRHLAESRDELLSRAPDEFPVRL